MARQSVLPSISSYATADFPTRTSSAWSGVLCAAHPVFSAVYQLDWGTRHCSRRGVATPRITLVVFSDKHLPDDEWTDLAAALHHTFENAALESHSPIAGFDIVRGDTLSPGGVFDTVIPVYLHGECRLLGQPGQEDVRGPLGWVFRSHGHIEPFIHVDCTRLSGVLGHQALWMNHGTRNAAMAEAIAHVVLHEWIHIATQSSAHTRDGISKDSLAWRTWFRIRARFFLTPGGSDTAGCRFSL